MLLPRCMVPYNPCPCFDVMMQGNSVDGRGDE